MTEPLLTVEDLRVDFATPKGLVQAVRGISFSLGREKLGIVGESGSGKSVTGRSILKLIPPPGRVWARRLEFRGTDLLGADERAMRKIRGEGISMVMQDPKFSLNPVMTVGAQIAEAYRIHAGTSAAEAKRRSLEMLATVRIREPTSALDVTVQLQVLAIMDDLVTQRGMGLIFISHDLSLVASFCDRVLIMYGGRIMEVCDASRLAQAEHPYTRGLLNCLPRVEGGGEDLPVLNRDPAWLEQGL
jgi:peptide/nickel transport system ATP-binding protein